jgi:hypothetical protein
VSKKNEATITEEDVREEHQVSAKPAPHWAYLFGVIGGSFLLMIALIAFLGGQGG